MHDDVSRLVARQYSAWSYPEPIADMAEAMARGYHEFATPHKFLPLLWPEGRDLSGLRILVAGCGTNQAAYNAMAHPRAEVLGIDLSRPSLEHSQYLKDKHGLGNLQLRQMSLLQVAELGQRFDYIACTGVLHHLADPAAGLRALASVLAPDGMLNLMVYGQHARAGVYLLQEAFRRLGCGQDGEDVALVRATLASMDPKHSIHAYLSGAKDLHYDAGIVDTFLHPQDRAYTVPQVMDFLQENGLAFWSWADCLFYNPLATIPVTHPLQSRLAQLPELERWSIVELLTQARGTHRFLACHPARAASGLRIDFNDPAWLGFVPLARSGLTVAEPGDPTAGRRPRLQRLWHSFELTPIGAALFDEVDGQRSIEAVLGRARAALPSVTEAQAREFFALMHDWGHL